MALKIVRNDITKMETEAIVNTANPEVAVGAGCDRAVYAAAGHDELLSYRRDNIGEVAEGEVFITPGFSLKAKYIIHAVSPMFTGGENGEEEKLRSCYKKSLLLAKEKGIASVAFPLISTGSFGYPKEEGLRIAVDEIHAFLLENEMDVWLVVFDDKAKDLGRRIFPGLEEYIDSHYVEDKSGEEYCEDYDTRAESFATQTYGAERSHSVREERRRRMEALKAKESYLGAPSSAMTGVSAAFGKFMKASAAMDICAAPSMDEKAALDDGAALDVEAAWDDEDYDAYDEKIENLESSLAERMDHLSDTFSEYLMFLIKEKNLKNADVYNKAMVDKKVFSKIKNNVNYHPNKLTAMCLCMGAKLNMDETRDLLARAGYALSPCNKTDIIFSYFIETGFYDITELEIQLEEHGLPCLIPE
ncbi:MAG: macro domain-containing protein [Lachnospiraceae bacterium]|nr:macro domain-containing protein [Lachnospiraceae bacterium]